MAVGRICQRDVDLAEPEETAWQAAERMHQRTVGSLVVLNQNRLPIGIITDRDLVNKVLARGIDPHTVTVSDVMTQNPDTIREDAPIEDALVMMRKNAERRLPVVDDEEQLVGLLSLDDVVMLLAEEMTEVGELLKRQGPRSVAAK